MVFQNSADEVFAHKMTESHESGARSHLDERQPEVPVYTHVQRVSQCLGLIGPKINADQAHELFDKMTPLEPLHTDSRQ